MAKQRGFLKIEGTLGDVTFVKTQDGYLVKEKTDIGSRIATDKAFQRTRENNAEFGRAGKACKTLRQALNVLLLNAATGEYGDMLEMGILDPTKVTRTALQQAASVAGMMITTECMITELPKDEGHGGHGDGGMGGMGGMGGIM